MYDFAIMNLTKAIVGILFVLTPTLASGQTAKFRIEEATIESIQAAILRGELTSTRAVQLYLNRIKAYNGTCVNQPDGISGSGPIAPIKNARQLNALMTLNLRPPKREALGFDRRKARSMTDPRDNDPAMPDALEVAAQQDAYFASTGKLIGPLHGVVFSIKDQYDTFDMRTTGGMYDPKDELTAFSVGRLPSEPYRSFANERTLSGIRIGVIREHMNKKLFNEADGESIELAERAINDLRRLGATIVDPGPERALFQSCIDRFAPIYRNRMFTEQFPNLFPVDSSGKPTSDNISLLVDMFFDPSLVPAGPTIRSLGPAPNSGQAKYMLSRYLKERGDANIKTIGDLINKSNFYKDIRPEAGFVDRKAALEDMNKSVMLDMANIFQDRFAYQQVVLQCMAEQNLDALVSTAGNIPAYVLGAPLEPPLDGRTASVWGLLGQQGIPTLSVPAGFTTQVFDRVRDAGAPGGTRLAGPVPAKLPVGIMFFGRPFSEPTLLRIASAYEAATKHRIPPPDFGPLPEP